MNTDQDHIEIDKITEKIIGCAYLVSNTLGAGFLEKVYENALAIELRNAGIDLVQQYPVKVFYQNTVVGEFICDLLVESKIIVELKTAKSIDNVHFAQCMNYLKATGLRFGLLINFGNPRIEVKRVVSGF